MLSKKEQEAIKALPTIGYWSALSGLEVKKIEYGIENYAYVIAGAWCSQKSVHKIKIHYETETPYIKLKGSCFKFSECIKC